MGKSYYYMRGKLVETIKHKKAEDVRLYCSTCEETTDCRLFGISSIDGELRVCIKCEQFVKEGGAKV